MDSNRSSSSSDTVSMTIGVVIPAWRMALTPSTPEEPGMFTSMTTMSGRRARTFSSASRPFSPSPTTVMSNWALIRVARARRNRGWSSTSRTLSLGGWCATRVLCLEADDDARPLVRGSMHVERSTDLFDPFPHGGEAEAPLHRARDGRRVEAHAVVLDRKRRHRRAAIDADGDAMRARMLAGVGERLLHHAQQLDLAPRRQSPPSVPLAREAGGDPGLAA